jgi:hypothetical protein
VNKDLKTAIEIRDSQVSGLYRYQGDGKATCEECVKNLLDELIGEASPADWLDDEFGDTKCEECGRTVTPSAEKEAVK